MSHESLFRRIEEEIPGVLSAAVGTLEDGGSFSSFAAGDLDLDHAKDDLGRMIRAYAAAYDALGGRLDLGANDEILVSTSKTYLLVKIDHPSRRFVAVLLSSSGNIGYLRFRMRQYLREIAG